MNDDVWRVIAAGLVDGAMVLPSIQAGTLATVVEPVKVARAGTLTMEPDNSIAITEVRDVMLGDPMPPDDDSLGWTIWRHDDIAEHRAKLSDAVRNLSALASVSRDVRRAISPLWRDAYRSVAPIYQVLGVTHRVHADLRPAIGMDEARRLPDDWYRLRLGLLYRNPGKQMRKMTRRDRAMERLRIGYQSQPRARLKGHLNRVRRVLRRMERDSIQ